LHLKEMLLFLRSSAPSIFPASMEHFASKFRYVEIPIFEQKILF
jgi:hypothetical protein